MDMKYIRVIAFAVTAVGISFFLGEKWSVSRQVQVSGPSAVTWDLAKFLDKSRQVLNDEKEQKVALKGSIYCDEGGGVWLTSAPGVTPKEGEALLMPDWPLFGSRNEWSRMVVVEGEFNKLDAEIGFDSLSPILTVRVRVDGFGR